MASWQKNYKAANQAVSYQYTFSLAKIKSLKLNNLHLVDINKKDYSIWSNKSLNIGKLQSFYWNNWFKRSSKMPGFYQIGKKLMRCPFTLRS